MYTTLPDNVTEWNDFMCKNKSRHGFLCGECDPDYGAAINSFHSTCVECKRVYAVGMFILCAIFPMTIFFCYCRHVPTEHSIRTNAWLHPVLSEFHCCYKE